MKFNLKLLIPFIILTTSSLFANDNQKDSVDKAFEILKDAKVEAARKEIEITVRSVDISQFPKIKLMIEAYNKLGEPLDTLTADQVSVFENSKKQQVVEVQKVPAATEIPVDFVFLVDITGSMQPMVNSVISNISSFTQNLVKRGIDYRIGLILFGDDVERIYDPTQNVYTFLSWISGVKAKGGGDVKENSLEALEATTKSIKWRGEASRVAVLITDAPYHQKGEDGNGITDQTTESIIELLQKNQVRVFSIVPEEIEQYKLISLKSRGAAYDIEYPFSTILDNFSNQLTNLYNVTYQSEEEAIPDSIEIALFNAGTQRLIKKTIPIVELGRKLIIENLLFPTNSSDLPSVVRELDIMADFMNAKQNIQIMIEGHTDNVGAEGINDKLSLERANKVRDYLVSKGINASRIQTIGYGKKRPLASNKTEIGRRLNRRTEIIILNK
ncbi:MAG TPA: OmpA family protein [Candidatus Kapabacteria bacterium]|nr:OmpA family protein [Candidatus Kapabacteria bacterium]